MEHIETFYTSICDHYDRIFPGSEATVNLLAAGLEKSDRVLDLACGTGNYCLALAGRGLDVSGFDIDPASVASARRKAEAKGWDIRIDVLDMRRATDALAPASLRLAYCIGNSLVHLPDRPAVQAFIADVATLLVPGGRFIFQIINYDRILRERVDHLPTIERDGLRFIRDYEHRDDVIDFATTLELPDGKSVRNRVPLLALKRQELEPMLTPFADLRWYGALDREVPWSSSSYATVVEAGRTQRS